MQESLKKLLLQSNKELTVCGDLEVLILLHMDVKMGRPALHKMMRGYFGKEWDKVAKLIGEPISTFYGEQGQ